MGVETDIGVQFSRWGDMDEESRLAWFQHMRTTWGPDLMGGYATLVKVPPPERE